jgi:hypothetical protein
MDCSNSGTGIEAEQPAVWLTVLLLLKVAGHQQRVQQLSASQITQPRLFTYLQGKSTLEGCLQQILPLALTVGNRVQQYPVLGELSHALCPLVYLSVTVGHSSEFCSVTVTVRSVCWVL